MTFLDEISHFNLVKKRIKAGGQKHGEYGYVYPVYVKTIEEVKKQNPTQSLSGKIKTSSISCYKHNETVDTGYMLRAFGAR